MGGSATSDNVGPMNLLNIRRVAFGLKELSELRGNAPAPQSCGCTAAPKESCSPAAEEKSMAALSREEIEAITRAVLARLAR